MPPTIAEAILSGVIIDRTVEEEVLGDLAERWAERASIDGRRGANQWYWQETLRTTPYLLLSWCRRSSSREMRRTACAIAAGFVALAALNTPGERLVAAIFPVAGSVSAYTAGAIVDFIVGFASGVAAGRIGRRAPVANALAFALAYVVLAIVGRLVGGTAPIGYYTSLAAIVPGAIAATAGWPRLVSKGRGEAPDPDAPR